MRFMGTAAGLEQGAQTMERLEIPAYTDRWMMGDRYGDLLKVTKRWFHAETMGARSETGITWREIAHVRLDISGTRAAGKIGSRQR
jgi:hypothetical protein